MKNYVHLEKPSTHGGARASIFRKVVLVVLAMVVTVLVCMIVESQIAKQPVVYSLTAVTPCYTGPYSNSYSGGYGGDVSTQFSTLQSALAACATTNGCVAITESSSSYFTLRASSTLGQSSSGETSWLIVSCSPSPTPSPSTTASRTPSSSATASRTPSSSVTVSPTRSPSTTVSPSRSPSTTVTPTPSPSTTVTASSSTTASPTPSPSTTVSPPQSPSTTASLTPSPSTTVSPPQSPSTTVTPTQSPSTTASLTPSPSTTVSPTQSPSTTVSPTQSPSTTVSPTLSPSITASPSRSPSITVTPSPSPSNVVMCGPFPNQFIPTCAADNCANHTNFASAISSCQVDPTCTGVTLMAISGLYQLRSSSVLASSLEGDTSWLIHGCSPSPSPSPSPLSLPCYTGPYSNTYSFGFASGVSTAFSTFQSALAVCGLDISCSAITESGGQFTIRSGSLETSPSGETSWLVVPCSTSPSPTPSPSLPCNSGLLSNTDLPNCASDGCAPHLSLTTALAACVQDSKCLGVTFVSELGVYQTRQASTGPSEYIGHDSWLLISCATPTCAFGPYQNVYLSGCPGSCSLYNSVDSAMAACVTESTCSGVVYQDGLYTTRSSTVMFGSPIGQPGQVWIPNPSCEPYINPQYSMANAPFYWTWFPNGLTLTAQSQSVMFTLDMLGLSTGEQGGSTFVIGVVTTYLGNGQFQISNGDNCPNTNTTRSGLLQFVCGSPVSLSVTEGPTCFYTMTVTAPQGCQFSLTSSPYYNMSSQVFTDPTGVYTVTLFGKVTQGQVSIGYITFYYNGRYYIRNGDYCAAVNAQRMGSVHISCGPTNSMSIVEGPTCAFSFSITSPQACPFSTSSKRYMVLSSTQASITSNGFMYILNLFSSVTQVRISDGVVWNVGIVTNDNGAGVYQITGGDSYMCGTSPRSGQITVNCGYSTTQVVSVTETACFFTFVINGAC